VADAVHSEESIEEDESKGAFLISRVVKSVRLLSRENRRPSIRSNVGSMIDKTCGRQQPSRAWGKGRNGRIALSRRSARAFTRAGNVLTSIPVSGYQKGLEPFRIRCERLPLPLPDDSVRREGRRRAFTVCAVAIAVADAELLQNRSRKKMQKRKYHER
jgi:hypothetical protein